MTSPISSYSQTLGVTDPIGKASTSPVTTPPAESSSVASSGSPPAAAAQSGEFVTLTPDAQNSADLLEAARAAAGIDHQAVQSLKTEIASGTYQVPAEALAASIVAALTETQS